MIEKGSLVLICIAGIDNEVYLRPQQGKVRSRKRARITLRGSRVNT